MTPRGVIFDLDGTLIDSAPSLHRAAAAMMRQLGHAEPDLETVTGFVGNGVPSLVERCLTWAGAAMSPGAIETFRAIYDADPVTGVQVFDGAAALLSDLAARGVLLGLCTNKPEAPTMTLLQDLPLGPFGALACGDTLPVRKPDPAPLLHVINRLGLTAAEVVYVGDSDVDLRTARSAGVAYLHVSLGYENGSLDGLSESEIHADFASLARALMRK